MASRQTHEKWLLELTNLPTASGLEDAVVSWVRRWVGRRDDLLLRADSGGNLHITQRGRKRHAPVVAVAHMDHPGFVATAIDGKVVEFEFRGGVDAVYFESAGVVFGANSKEVRGVVAEYDSASQRGKVVTNAAGNVVPGAIGTWLFKHHRSPKGRFSAPACDDLAGAAAALSALDRARGDETRRHFSVLLTRAEEVGLVGAAHAARNKTVPENARVISIETSRELPNARIGDGPIVRVGDAVTIFDRDLTNRIAGAARSSGLTHQRRLMDGGGCEATAFGIYGYRSTGLCLALGNWHNRGNLDAVERGVGAAVPMLEEISLDDFHGLIELLGLAVIAIDQPDPMVARLQELFDAPVPYLD